MNSNTKKNKTCINLPDELSPLNIISSWMILDTINGITESTGEIISGVSS